VNLTLVKSAALLVYTDERVRNTLYSVCKRSQHATDLASRRPAYAKEDENITDSEVKRNQNILILRVVTDQSCPEWGRDEFFVVSLWGSQNINGVLQSHADCTFSPE
jgi:hypothetical protein